MDFAAVNTAVKNRVGVRDTNDPLTYPHLDSDVTTATGGLLINEVSEKWLAVDQLDQMLTWHDNKNLSDWDNATDYGLLGGIQVFHTVGGVKTAYISKPSLVPNQGLSPDASPNFWQTALSAELTRYRDNAVTSMIGDLGNFRSIEAKVDQLKGYNQLWLASSQNRERNKQGRFIFFYIFPKRNPEHVLRMLKVGMKVDTAQTLPFYLYHSDSQAALQQFDVVFGAGDVNKFTWKAFSDQNGDPAIFKSFDDEQAGGVYMLGFYESDLIGNLFGWDNSYPLMGGGRLNNYGWPFYGASKRHFSVVPGQLNSSRVTNKPALPEIGEYFDGWEDDGNLYFNLWFSVHEDFTNVVTENVESSLFDRLFQLKWAILLLEDMRHSKRFNLEGSERKEIDQLLDGKESTFASDAKLEKTYTSGVKKKYEAELTSVMNSLANVSTDKRGLVNVL